MDYRKVQLFLAAARHGNLTEAASSLEISQPALSKSIKALEKSLGVRLLERGRFGVSLTPYGQSLMQHGQVIEAEMRNAQGAIQALRGALRGHVVIGCGPTEANRLLPVALKELRQSSPEIKLTVLYGLNEALMPWVKQGEVDFALSSVPSRSADADLMHEHLLTETATVVARAGHPLLRHKLITPQLLMQYPWILPRQRELERLAFDDYFLSHGLEPPTAQVETTSTVLMKSLVMQSDVLTFIPKELIYWEARAGQLVSLQAVGNQWARRVGITRRRKGSMSPAGKLLLQSIKAAALTHF
ncbi:MAG: LysR family transcriptional regulator [Betaproteobacteria bacterium]|jgi:DNA-binding transcriptional LysR family regulator|nr:LysR family transcriptional regulator [Betaproteobacteria bacterium]